MKNILTGQGEKTSDQAFMQSVIISVVSILLCIVMLCSLTFAWFSAEVASTANTLGSGHFSAEVLSIVRHEDDGTVAENAQALLPDAAGVYTLAQGRYTVTLQPTPETTVKGYCVVTVNREVYRTESMKNEQAEDGTYTPVAFTFQIEVTGAETTVKIESRWGVPAEPSIVKDGAISIATAPSGEGAPEDAPEGDPS